MSRKEKLIVVLAILIGALSLVWLNIYDNETGANRVNEQSCHDVYIDTNTVVCK